MLAFGPPLTITTSTATVEVQENVSPLTSIVMPAAESSLIVSNLWIDVVPSGQPGLPSTVAGDTRGPVVVACAAGTVTRRPRTPTAIASDALTARCLCMRAFPCLARVHRPRLAGSPCVPEPVRAFLAGPCRPARLPQIRLPPATSADIFSFGLRCFTRNERAVALVGGQ